MFTHEQIWRSIDLLAKRCGLSTSGLAKKAGLDPTSFNKSKRLSPEGKERWPSTESLSKILAATGTSMDEFVELTNQAHPNSKQSSHIPIIDFSKVERGICFDEHGLPNPGEVWDLYVFPGKNDMNDPNAFAIEISAPMDFELYRRGDVVIVSPAAEMRHGDRVIVKTKGGKYVITELQKKTATKIEVTSYNKSKDHISLQIEDISWMSRIVWVSQ